MNVDTSMSQILSKNTIKSRSQLPLINQNPLDKALNDWLNMSLHLAAKFYRGLMYPRSKLHTSFKCNQVSFESYDDSNKQIVANFPHVDEVMSDYILTQILPLQLIMSNTNTSVQSFQFNNTKTQQFLIDKFNTIVYPTDSVVVNNEQCTQKQGQLKTQIISKNNTMSLKAAEHFLRAKEYLHSYLTSNKQLHTYIDYMNELLKLSAVNSLNIVANDLQNNYQYQQLVKAMVWLLTSIVDWLDTNVIEPSDVQILAEMLIPASLNIDANKISKILNQSHFEDQITYKKLYEVLYRVLYQNHLHAAQPALTKLTNLFMYIHENQSLLKPILNQAKFYTKLQ